VSDGPIKLPSLLREFGISPKKSLGQNFLVDEPYLQRIVTAAKIDKQTDVLEIGAGAGNLTRYLAREARSVTAVEIDEALFPLLKKITAPYKNILLVQGDILEKDINELMQQSGYVVAANIPYYITSNLIRFLLESPLKPSRMVLTIQHEVAQRICAQAGALSLLALSVQVYGEPRIAFQVPAGAFHPVPGVDSAVLIIDLYSQPRIPREQIDDFFILIKAGFSQKRKMLRNTLASAPGLDKDSCVLILKNVEIDTRRRAQTLTVDEWGSLTAAYQDFLAGNTQG